MWVWKVQSNKSTSSAIKVYSVGKNRNDGLSTGLDNCDCRLVAVYLWILLVGGSVWIVGCEEGETEVVALHAGGRNDESGSDAGDANSKPEEEH